MIPAWGGLLKAISDVPFVPLVELAISTSSFCQAHCAGKEHRKRAGVSVWGEPAKSVIDHSGYKPTCKVFPVKNEEERLFMPRPSLASLQLLNLLLESPLQLSEATQSRPHIMSFLQPTALCPLLQLYHHHPQ